MSYGLSVFSLTKKINPAYTTYLAKEENKMNVGKLICKAAKKYEKYLILNSWGISHGILYNYWQMYTKNKLSKYIDSILHRRKKRQLSIHSTNTCIYIYTPQSRTITLDNSGK